MIDRDKPQKLYIQLYEILKEKIQSGQWALDDKIPTEEELCRIYSVSKATIRLALSELARQGFLRRQQGKGTFVSKKEGRESVFLNAPFRDPMLDQRVAYTEDIIARTVMMPIEGLEEKLRIPEDWHIVYLKKLFKVDGRPAVVQEAYVPYGSCPALIEAEVSSGSIIDFVEKTCGLTISRVICHFDVKNADPETARLLGIPGGSPVLMLEQRIFSGPDVLMYMNSFAAPAGGGITVDFERKS